MKKSFLIVVSILLVLVLILVSAYLIDLNCMNNNKPVIFSTWGYSYAPQEESGDGIQIPNKTMDNKEVIYYSKDGYLLSMTLPNDWEYEIVSEETDRYEYSIKFYPAGSERYAILYSYKERFGVCGTDLRCEDFSLENGTSATAGYYGDDWSFITFGYDEEDEEIVANNNGLKDLEAKTAIEILKTLKYERNTGELTNS